MIVLDSWWSKGSAHSTRALFFDHFSFNRGGRNRIGRREKWHKQSWEEGEIGGKSREEGEKEKLTFREEGEIGSKSREEGEIGSDSREKGDLPPVPPPS